MGGVRRRTRRDGHPDKLFGLLPMVMMVVAMRMAGVIVMGFLCGRVGVRVSVASRSGAAFHVGMDMESSRKRDGREIGGQHEGGG